MGMVYHCGDPFSGVDGAMPHYGLLGAFASGSPDVDAEEITALIGCPCRKSFRIVRICSSEITDEALVIGKSMVCVEPSSIWN